METKEKHLLGGLAICVATALIYFPAIFFNYVWDDWVWLNSLARYEGDIFTLAFLKPFLIGDVYWRPLAELTLYLQPGDKPQIFQHTLNILIHLGNVLLMVLVGRRAASLGRLALNKWFYLFILFFALHPAFIEPVVWVSGRFDLLLATFYLLGVLCLLSKENTVGQGVGASLFFLLGLLVKESAVLFIPLYIGTLWFLNPNESFRNLISRYKWLLLAMAAILVLWLIARELVLGKTGAGFLMKNLGVAILPQKIYMVLSTIGAYALLLIFPFKSLSSLYPVDEMLGNIWYAVAGTAYLLLTIVLFRLPGEARKVGVILSLFVISLLLVINVLDVGFADNLIQNRYLYPSFAVILVCIFLGKFSFTLTRIGDRAFTLLAIGWLAISVININSTLPLWKNSDSLSQWLYIENPGNPYAANMRATILINRGYVEAGIETAGEVAIHRPTHGAYIILGDGHLMLGQCKDALVYYKYAYELGGFAVEKAGGLLGVYRLTLHEDEDEASEIKERIEALLKSSPDDLANARERMEMFERQEIECRDES